MAKCPLSLDSAVGFWFPRTKITAAGYRLSRKFFPRENPRGNQADRLNSEPVQQLIQQRLDDPLPRDDPTLGVELNRADR